jgi:hypothetical protein
MRKRSLTTWFQLAPIIPCGLFAKLRASATPTKRQVVWSPETRSKPMSKGTRLDDVVELLMGS